MVKNVVLILLCHLFIVSSEASTLHVGLGYVYSTITQASITAKGGDTIMCHDPIIQGAQFITNLQGSEGKYIHIMAESGKSITIQGGNNSIQFSDCNYISVEGFIIQGQTGNGMNIDDGGTLQTPTHHWKIKKCIFRNINATGNNDLLKLSGLEYFEISDCSFLNGAIGGSGIDMVGCHFGTIGDNKFENLGANSIQAKGGTFELDILRNHFINGGARALNLGGSTGLEFFRPLNATTEAERIRVIANVIEGSEAAIAFVGCAQVVVANNTILFPKKWILRILQETVDPTRFLPSGNNSFFNNIVVVDNNVTTDVNIGPNTAPETFSFENNLWYKTTNASWSGPNLPGKIINSKVANPLIIAGSIYRIPLNSPATEIGKIYGALKLDKDKRLYNIPPSIGAYEANPLATANNDVFADMFKAYPNPFYDNMHLSFADQNEKTISVYSINGQLINKIITNETNLELKMDQFQRGTYLINVKLKNRKFQSALIYKN